MLTLILLKSDWINGPVFLKLRKGFVQHLVCVATGGSLKLRFGSETTLSIPFNATREHLQVELERLGGILNVDITLASGGPICVAQRPRNAAEYTPVTIEFRAVAVAPVSICHWSPRAQCPDDERHSIPTAVVRTPITIIVHQMQPAAQTTRPGRVMSQTASKNPSLAPRFFL